MSETISPESAKKAQELLDKKLVQPLDDLSNFSINAVADAAETIAKAKLEAASRAAEAARQAMARVAAMKAAAAAPEAAAVEPAPEVITKIADPSPASVAEPVAMKPVLVTEPKEEKVIPMVDRREGDRRNEQPRRTHPERRVESMPVPDERRADFRRMSLGRRADDPSGVVRLANAVRASISEQADRRRSVAHDENVKLPGSVLDPVARKAGHGPRSTVQADRRIFTPQLIGLLIVMGLFGMYATGNLPQFDQWTDSLVNKAHANNDKVVGAIAHNWHAEAYVAIGVMLLVVVFLVRNSLRARSND